MGHTKPDLNFLFSVLAFRSWTELACSPNAAIGVAYKCTLFESPISEDAIYWQRNWKGPNPGLGSLAKNADTSRLLA
jgi:hypothetical protein